MPKTILFIIWTIVAIVLVFRIISTHNSVRSTLIPFHGIVTIVGYPQENNGKVYYNVRLSHLLTQVSELRNIQYQTNIRIAVSEMIFKHGDTIEVQGLLSPYNTITVFKHEYIAHHGSPLVNSIYSFRKDLEDKISIYLPMDDAAVALGMTIGSNLPMSPDVKQSLQQNGTVHMLVASGSNITVLVTVVMLLAGIIHRRIAAICALIAVAGFITINGFQPPAVRAGYMALLAIIAQQLGRYTSKSYLFISACTLYIFFQPQIITNISFQLSVAATAGVVYISSWLNTLNQQETYHELTPTIGAQIAVLPITWYYFNNASVIGFIANSIVSWLVPFISFTTVLLIPLIYINENISYLASFITRVFTAIFIFANLLISSGANTLVVVLKSNLAIPLIIIGVLAIMVGITRAANLYSNMIYFKDGNNNQTNEK